MMLEWMQRLMFPMRWKVMIRLVIPTPEPEDDPNVTPSPSGEPTQNPVATVKPTKRPVVKPTKRPVPTQTVKPTHTPLVRPTVKPSDKPKKAAPKIVVGKARFLSVKEQGFQEVSHFHESSCQSEWILRAV